MKKLIAISAIVIAGTAAAQDSYVEGTLGSIGGIPAVGVKFGTNYNKTFGLEGQFMTGSKTETYTSRIYTGNLTTDLTTYGIFGTARTSLTPSTEAYARLGVTKSEVTAKMGRVSASQDETSASVGVGLRHSFTPRFYGVIDYTLYNNKYDVHGTHVSLGYRF